jgi:hypothetical protein
MSLLRNLTLVLVCGLFPCVVGACSVKGAVDDAGSVDVDAKVDVRELLGELFPKLTDAELEELSTSVDLETVLALKADLEKVRKEAAEFSDELFTTSEERVTQRKTDLESHNEGYPTSLEAIAGGAFYSKAKGEVRIELSGLFSNKASYSFGASDVSVELDGVAQTPDVSCLAGGDSVDLVFLVDVTGSMSNVIDSVRSSLLSFVDALKSSDLDGTISVVSFQDTVGEQVSFQELEKNGFERSPFIANKKLSSSSQVRSRALHRQARGKPWRRSSRKPGRGCRFCEKQRDRCALQRGRQRDRRRRGGPRRYRGFPEAR